MMEVFAGFLEHTDHHIGRLIAFLEKMGQLDNTLIMVVSDNGASAEGGPHGSVNENLFFNNVPETLEDGPAGDRRAGRAEVLQPLPVGLGVGGQHAVPPLEARDLPRRRRPIRSSSTGRRGIKAKGEIRDQYAHVIDMVPTVLEALGDRAAGRRSAA